MAGFGQGIFIIAEAGSNWRMGTRARDLKMGMVLIEEAAEAGADAVKFQTYRPETVYVENAGESDYLQEAGIKESIVDIFADLAMPYEMIPLLAEHAEKCGIKFMSTPFSLADLAAVDPYVDVHKIASYEISHLRLIEAVAGTGKPLIMSTGASVEEDIALAVETFRNAGNGELVLMQCTAKYPAPLASLNLKSIPWLAKRFGCLAGLSDHSRDPIMGPVAGAALGAKVIEKHFTLHNRLPGPDHAFAITASELKSMVSAVRQVESMMGEERKAILEEERELAAYARRGIQATVAIAKGETLREGINIDILRPGKQRLGIHPKYLSRIEGKMACRDIPLGDGIFKGDWLA